MPWIVYMIRCDNGSLYTGVTNNMPRRLAQHQSGEGSKYLRGKGFLTVAWTQDVADKSCALKLECRVKKLPKCKKEELVLSSNPLLSAYLQHHCNNKLQSGRFEHLLGVIGVREELTTKYSWAIPSEEALREIARLSPIVEIGAGTGYWASLLRKMGADVVAYDRSPPGAQLSLLSACNLWHPDAETHSEVLEGVPSVLKQHSDRTLLLCWPPMDSFASQCLKHWKGKKLVYVGEYPGGCTANDRFHNSLHSRFRLAGTVKIPQWPNIHDYVSIWIRS